MDLEFFDDARSFLDAAGGLLRAEPLQGSVIATVSERFVREAERGADSWAEVGAPFRRWWAVVRDEHGAVVGAAMRTAPFAPHPVYTLPLTAPAASALAHALRERGEHLGGVNGGVPGADLLARETARLHGGRAVRHSAMRLWEATEVEVPPSPPGRLRRAQERDAALVRDWYAAFDAESDRQSGREPTVDQGSHHTLEGALVRIREGSQWLWEDPAGEVVHLSGRTPPAYDVSRVGPVFTPAEHRGRGIASYVVAELTRRGLVAGHRMCLFTDLDNPVSNRIYARVGYRPVADTAEWLVRGAQGAPGEAEDPGREP